MVKSLPAMQETWVWSLGWEDPLEDGMATHSSILAWRMDRGAWQAKVPWRLLRVRHNWVTKHSTSHILPELTKKTCLNLQHFPPWCWPLLSICHLWMHRYKEIPRMGTDCGSGYELLIAKFRLKKVGKINRPFRYDLIQIPYNYRVEVRNRLKGLDLIDTVPEELWMEVRDIVKDAVIKTLPKRKNAKRQNDCLRRP